ncbi:MAG: High-affnity carbon uptake protein Hat/HatR [Gemmataceae bacterium]|nr:High-affnity carbon uptake protein Hat/HatR [Gemmataceae bacterium]
MPTAIFHAVLANLAVAAVLAVPAVAVGRWSRRPAVAHAAWLVVLIKLVTPPLLTIPLPVLPAATPAAASSPISRPAHPPAVPAVVVPVLPEPRPTPEHIPIRPGPAVGSRPTPAPTPGPQPTGRPSLPWDTVVVIVWGAGAAGWGWLTLSRARRFGRLLRFATDPPTELTTAVATAAERIGLARPPQVRVLPGGIAPFVWGIVRPTLYFPAGLLTRLSADERLTLIVHELAHVRRADHLVRTVEFVTTAAYWWCPLAWYARRELRRFEEEACDAEVAGALPGAGFTYASAVLETIDFLAGARRAPFPASGIGDTGSLRRRLALILDSPSPRPSRAGRFVVLAVGVIAVAFGPKVGRSVGGPVPDLAAGNAPAAVSAPNSDPLSGDDPTAESTHYLTTPTRFILPAAAPDPILAAALSPDGRRLVVATGSTVTVWDLPAARTSVTLTGHTGTVAAVAFSPDGTRLATAGHDGAVKLWAAADGREQATFGGHTRWAVAVAFSPDGRTLASGGYDATVRLWDLESGRERAVLTGHTGGVRAVAFSPDGRTVASGGADHEVRLWDTTGGKRPRVLRRHSGPIRAIAYSPEGARLATGGEDRTVLLWHPSDGREVAPPVRLPDFVTALRFSPTGQTLLVGTDGGHVLNTDPLTAHPRGYLGIEPGFPSGRPAHAAALVATLFPPAAAGAVYTVAQDRSVAVWSAAGPPEVPAATFPGHRRPVAAVALTADGRTLAAGGQDGSFRLWDADSAVLRRTIPAHPGGVTALVFAATGQLVSAGADERVRVWDLASGQAVRTLTYTTADLRLALSPDGRLLAVGGPGLSAVTLWDLDTLAPVRHLGSRSGGATAVAFNPAGTGLVTGHPDGGVRVWAADSGRELIGGVVGPGQVDGLAFTPDGRTVAAVVNGVVDDGPAGTARPVHDVIFLDTGTAATADRQPLVHPGPVTAVAFTRAGVLTAGQNGHLYLWDPAGRPVRAVRGYNGAVRAVAPTPDGSAVFSAGDHTAKRWAFPPLRPGRQSSGP